MGKRRQPQSQWASQGFKRTGFSNWLDYNESTDTLRYGTYDINPTLLGLKRNKQVIDPSKVKSIDDIYTMMGADPNALKQHNQFPVWSGLFGGQQKPQVFSGADEWKNTAATQLWEMMRPKNAREMIYGRQTPTSIDSQSPNYSQIAGLLGQTNSNTPFGGFNTGTIVGGQAGMGIPSMQPKATTYHKIYKGDDGMWNFESGDLIPDTKDFAQRVSDMAWQLSNQGYNSRYGKDPSGVGKDPRGNPSPVTQGKKPTLL